MFLDILLDVSCKGTPVSILLSCHRFEASALTLRSLRREVLCLLSAGSKIMSDPDALLAQALDPPETNRVSQAMEYLKQVIRVYDGCCCCGCRMGDVFVMCLAVRDPVTCAGKDEYLMAWLNATATPP